MLPYQDDFTRFYFEDGHLITAQKVSEVPDEIEDFATIGEAVSFVQRLGAWGRSQHTISSEYHRLCLAILRWAVGKYGQKFPEILRGVRTTRPESEHLILFGTRDRRVAEFYGEVRAYQNVYGLLTHCSALKSVVTDDHDYTDEEIIFFPCQQK